MKIPKNRLKLRKAFSILWEMLYSNCYSRFDRDPYFKPPYHKEGYGLRALEKDFKEEMKKLDKGHKKKLKDYI